VFCPKCKAEYVGGVRECAECGVPLVATLTEERTRKDLDLVCILETSNANDVIMIESILDGSGIEYVLEGTHTISILRSIEPARLLVPKDQEEEAKDLLKDLKILYTTDLSMDLPADWDPNDKLSEVEDGESET
jgi:hypothetical protein